MRRMSDEYNIIEHIPIGLRPFGLKCVSICYINYSRKLPKVFIHPTSGIRAKLCAAKVVKCSWSLPNKDRESLNGPHTKILEKKRKKRKSPTKEYC